MTTAAEPPPCDAAAADAARSAGNAAFKAADFGAALAFYRQAMALAPAHDARPAANAAAAALRLGDPEAARAFALTAVAADPRHAKSHARLATAEAALHNVAAAAAAWEAAAAAAPECGATARAAAAARAAADEAARVERAAAAVRARVVADDHLKASRAATRACMQLQYQNSMAAPEWELEDYDWRPTHAPHHALTPAHAPPPAAPTLAALVAAAADVAAPRAAAVAAADAGRVAAWSAALHDVCSSDSIDQAIVIGGAGGAWGLVAAAAGARAVTIFERTPLGRTLAMAGLDANVNAPWAVRVRVADGWVSSLAVGECEAGPDASPTPSPPPTTALPTPPSLIAIDTLDATPLGAGLLRAADAVAAARAAAATTTVLPARVRVLARLVDATPRDAAGVDVSALAPLRWGLQPERVDVTGPDAPTFLSAPFIAADIDLRARVLAGPAAAADRRAAAAAGVLEADATVAVPITAAGTANGVLTWVEIDLGPGGWVTGWGGVTGGAANEQAVAAPSYGVAMHAMDGVWVAKHATLPLRVRRDAAHLTFTPAATPCRALRHARIPPWHWPMLADASRATVLARAAARAVAAARARGVADPHVLDAGAGSGLLGVLVARATNARVTCIELSPALAAAAAAVVDAAGVGHRVTVLCGDVRRASVAGEQPVRGAPPPGAGPTMHARAHVLLFEVFDAGGIGEGALHVASAVRRALCVADAVSVPAAAALWCCPVELDAPALPAGVRADHLTAWRTTNEYEAVDPAAPAAVGAAAWRPLAAPTRVDGMTFDFTSPLPPTPASTDCAVTMTHTGTVHAVAFWVDLDVGGGDRLATGGWRGKNVAPSFRTALQWLAPVAVAAGQTLTLTASHDTYGITFGVAGEPARSPLPPALAATRTAAADAANALSAAAAASPLAFRAVATAAAAVGARPGDWGLDAGAAGGVCGRLFL